MFGQQFAFEGTIAASICALICANRVFITNLIVTAIANPRSNFHVLVHFCSCITIYTSSLQLR